MKKSFFIVFFCFLVGTQMNSQNSIPIPFLQPFESFTYNSPPNLVRLEVADSSSPGDTDCPPTTDMIKGEGYSWFLSTRGNPTKGKSLRLTVHPEDHPCNAVSPRDRSEVRYTLPPLHNTTSYIQWQLYIPDDLSFIDEETSSQGGKNPYHKLFQIASNDSSLSYPLVGLDYIHEENAPNNKRDLMFLIRSAVSSSVVRRVHISDAIVKGEWTEITYKSYWSNSDFSGKVEIWINDKPVILDLSDPKNQPINPNKYYCILGNNQEDPLQVYCATTSFVGGAPARNKIKFGHYRQLHYENDNDHTIYIDDLKVTGYEPITEIPTKLANQYCDANIPIDNYNISCDPVSANGIPANNYIFRFEKDASTYYWVNSSNTSINLLNYSFLEPATTYKVQVRAQGPTFDFNYGDICTITTPHKTKLRSTDCGDTDSPNYNSTIGALKVMKATNYKFQFRDDITNALFYKNTNSSSTFITPSSVNGVVPGRLYHVKVRAQGLPDFDFDYGAECEIKFESNSKLVTNNKTDFNTGQPIVTPNPFTDLVHINSFENEIPLQFIVFDLSGNIVFKKENSKGISEMDLSFLKRGMYLAKVVSSTKTQTIKLIKE